jgi:transcriptional regulator with XRE-family HTH domain
VDQVQKAFVVNMKRTRNAMGLSQMKLAELSDLSTSFIAEIESGKKFPSSASIERIARALSLRPYQLFLGEDDRRDVDAAGRIAKLARELKVSVSATIEETTRKIIAEMQR